MPGDPCDPFALVAEVRDGLARLADAERAPRMQAYMRSVMPYRGVPMPEVRRLCREEYRARLGSEAHWRTAVLALWDDAAYREERYAALELARHGPYAAYRHPGVLPLYRHLLVTGAWWDLVDPTSQLVGDLLRAERTAVTPVLREWATSDDRWLRRCAIICQVGHRDEVDRDLLRFVVEHNLDGSTRTTPARSPFGRDFFVRKAIGWALRDAARTAPEWVLAFVASHEEGLSGLSRREALKHLA